MTKGRFFAVTESVTVRDLRVTVSIAKSLESTPNTATVNVYNLAERTRAEFQQRPLQVRLEAGYADGGLATLFVGDVRFARSSLGGVDWVTRLELGDGARARKHARVSRSFKAGTTMRTVLDELAKSMGLTAPKSTDEISALGAQVANGIALSGPSHAELTRVLKASGLGWSIQDHQLQVLPRGGALASTAIVFSEHTGMVGVPEFGAPEQGGKPPTLAISKLIDPSALPTPGRKIVVSSRAVNGTFRVTRVTHHGDTHGAEWRSDVEAVAA